MWIVFSPILQPYQQKGLKKQSMTTGSTVLSALQLVLVFKKCNNEIQMQGGGNKCKCTMGVKDFQELSKIHIRLDFTAWTTTNIVPWGKKKSNNCEDIVANTDPAFWRDNCLHHSETDSGWKCSSRNCLHNDFSGRVFPFCSRPGCALCAIILYSQNIWPFESLN